MAVMFYRSHNMNTGHCQLARSLERILEEAQISGELRLSNRKLKEFPRAATKYNLSDTVIADLSRNRFCELPEEITSFAFLETLILYHNTIRTIPPSVKGLTSLTYLDLRSNHLISLPREICFLPLQVLLIAHNRLTSLPDELGRMEKLTDLDVSCNQIANLPTRIGDLKSLRSLSVRSNQLIYLPRELTFLSLVSLDISNNRISSLPIEIRQMTTLVSLKLENNPLTSPPSSLCIRGLVHIVKFLEIQAYKDDKVKSGSNADGFATLRRTPRNPPCTIDDKKLRRHHIDSGYCTSDGLDKRWSQDNLIAPARNGTFSPKTSPTLENVERESERSVCIKELETNTTNAVDQETNIECLEQKIDNSIFSDICNNSENTSPDDDLALEKQKLDGKNKHLCNIQTYREYKEALKQQRNQDVLNVYRTKGQQKLSNDFITNIDNNPNSIENTITDCLIKTNGICEDVKHPKIDIESNIPLPIKNVSNFEDNFTQLKKPVQKVIPSRNLKRNKMEDKKIESDNECCDYIKPVYNGISASNHTFISNKTESAVRGPKLKLSRNVSWNQDTSSEILSFTMRREFDKQKEETELLAQLRTIIETRLKMNLPEDIASALTDGVVLCHLANYVRPRSVASIHVPSPGVPKLTMARCRRNVDNFLEACRKIGVDEELICSCADVVSNEEMIGECLQNPIAVYRTISALLSIVHSQQHKQGDQLTSATNSKIIGQQESEHHRKTTSIIHDSEVKYTDNTEDPATMHIQTELMEQLTTSCSSEKGGSFNIIFNTKEICCCNGNSYFSNNNINNTDALKQLEHLNDGNINAATTITTTKTPAVATTPTAAALPVTVINTDQENSQREEILKVNNLNAPNTFGKFYNFESSNNLNLNNDSYVPQKIVTKRIEFFETNNCCNKTSNDRDIFSIYNPSQDDRKNSSGTDSLVLTVFLSSVFIATFLLLIIFPLPN